MVSEIQAACDKINALIQEHMQEGSALIDANEPEITRVIEQYFDVDELSAFASVTTMDVMLHVVASPGEADRIITGMITQCTVLGAMIERSRHES